MPLVISVSGFKNSGKTSLSRDLVLRLSEKGFKVAYVKHTHEKVFLSGNGNDTGDILSEGVPSFLWGNEGIISETPDMDFSENNLNSEMFHPYDIVILEGGKSLNLPKIWVGPYPEDKDIPGIICFYEPVEPLPGKKCFFKGQESDISNFIADFSFKLNTGIEIFIKGRKIPVKKFVADIFTGSIIGMLSSLKGVNSLEDISIFISKKRS